MKNIDNIFAECSLPVALGIYYYMNGFCTSEPSNLYAGLFVPKGKLHTGVSEFVQFIKKCNV